MPCFKAADTLQITSLLKERYLTFGCGIRQPRFLAKPFSAQVLVIGEHPQNHFLSLGQVYWAIYWVIRRFYYKFIFCHINKETTYFS